MNRPRKTYELSEMADAAHRIAIQTGRLDLIEVTAQMKNELEELDASIEHAVTTLRCGMAAPSAARQREQSKDRDRWKHPLR